MDLDPRRPEPGTCVHDSLYLYALIVQLLGEGVHGLQQVFAGLWVDVGSPCRDFNWNHRGKNN